MIFFRHVEFLIALLLVSVHTARVFNKNSMKTHLDRKFDWTIFVLFIQITTASNKSSQYFLNFLTL